MDEIGRFRTRLAGRLLRALGVAAMAPLTQLACSSDSDTNPSGSTSSTGETSSSSTSVSSTSAGPTSSSSSTTGPGGSGGVGVGGGGGAGGSAGGAGGRGVGGAGVGGGGGGLGVGGFAQLCPPKEQCFPIGVQQACPPQDQAIAYFNDDCSDLCAPLTVESGPSFDGTNCCYDTTQYECGVIGRPFVMAGSIVIAGICRRTDGGWLDRSAAPDVAALAPETREALARAWIEDGLLEHASVASFARFSMELLAVGAPSDLVAAAHEAALDEVRHAKLCFALASRYAGAEVGPDRFPFEGAVLVSSDLADVAARAVREGCIGETVAALLAAEQRARATDPAVRAALAAIAEDESRHAELAWRAVHWAVRVGGERVRAAVDAVFDEAERELGANDVPERGDPLLEAHGRIDAGTAAEVRRRGLVDVVLPCARALRSVSERELRLAAV